MCINHVSDAHYVPSFPTRRSSDLARGEPVALSSGSLGGAAGIRSRRCAGRHYFKPAVGRRRQVAARSLDREPGRGGTADRKSTRLNSSHSQISYAVFCLKKKIKQ